MEVEVLRKIIEIDALCESENTEGAWYLVKLRDDGWSCSCLHHQKRGVNCKHIKAVQEQTE